MPKRLRSLLLVALLLGWGFGCAHRPDPTAKLLRVEPSAPLEAEFILALSSVQSDLAPHAATPHAAPAPIPERVYRGQGVFITVRPRHHTSEADFRLTMEIRKPGFFRPLERASFAGLGLRFQTDARDPLGDYTLILRLHDAASGRTCAFKHTIRVEAYLPPTLSAGFQAQNWLTHYYLQPTPALALPALRELHSKLPADKRPGALPPLLGFYDQLLRDNPWLLPAFASRLAAADPDEAYLLSLVLGFHLRNAGATRPAELDETTWTRLADFRTYDWPSDPEAPLADITQLDALWGRFFAAGRYADLQTLLRPLAHHADLGAAERWQRETRVPPAPGADLTEALAEAPPEVRRDLLLRSALWSLRSNARQHPLVRTYLERSLASGELTPGAKALLRANPANEEKRAVPPARFVAESGNGAKIGR